ncbi:hypothetical protein PSD17_06540 [Pseudonocardia sp. D17]|nr:hypothetical protein PSD17_06540 [Pseudonocardia sp. D17]
MAGFYQGWRPVSDIDAAMTQVESFVAGTAELMASDPAAPSLPARLKSVDFIYTELQALTVQLGNKHH